MIPTWDTDAKEPVESVSEPGSVSPGFGRPKPLCACDGCRALFREVAA